MNSFLNICAQLQESLSPTSIQSILKISSERLIAILYYLDPLEHVCVPNVLGALIFK